MEQEEQDVINEFQGEKEYNKVFSNPNLYLNSINNILMIEEKQEVIKMTIKDLTSL